MNNEPIHMILSFFRGKKNTWSHCGVFVALHQQECYVSMLLLIYSTMVLTKAAWALVSVTVSEVPAIMIAGTMAIVAVL